MSKSLRTSGHHQKHSIILVHFLTKIPAVPEGQQSTYLWLQSYWETMVRIRGLLGVGAQGTPTKNEKSANLAHYFSGVAMFCVTNKHQT